MRKKAIFFSTDAIIATIIIILVLLVAVPLTTKIEPTTQVHADLLKVMSSLKTNEINSTLIENMIASGQIEDPNKSIIEQIGEFYVTNKTLARNMASEVLTTLDSEQGIGIWYANELIASKNQTPFSSARGIEVQRQVISGLKEGNSTTGFAARAFLASDVQTEYFYFGGYVGDGNISTHISYNGTLQSVELELTISENFTVYVNNISQGTFEKSSSDTTPNTYTIPIGNFSEGDNLLEIQAATPYISGGFVKIVYEGYQGSDTDKYSFPGLSGLVNLYDGFYNANLESMEVFLKLDSQYELFLSIGNTTVWQNATTGEETINLSDSYLSGVLDYSALSNKTVPIRLGFTNTSYVTSYNLSVDSFSVTDLSGSMAPSCSGGGFWCCVFSGNFCGSNSTCTSCGGTWEDKIDLARQANLAFIEGILNTSGNSVGLAGYRSTASNADYHTLSTNETSLDVEVNSWTASGGTCICCGINKGAAGIDANATDGNLKTLVVMSDGQATDTCPEQGTGDPADDAIQAACDAYNNTGIRVYAVGFGAGADETTLQQIASCGNGTYYFGDVDNIIDLYQTIAEDILRASFSEQTISTSGNFNETSLSPESYIRFTNSLPSSLPSGVILSLEETFSNETTGAFTLPSDASIVSAEVVSYSGSKWTDTVTLNGNTIYNLSRYGDVYTNLGDPYVVNLPNQHIQTNNTVDVKTALGPLNQSNGSISNKIIYKIQKNPSSFSSISPFFEGCNWTIEFEDNTNTTIPVPANYNGTALCSYTSSSTSYDTNDAMQEAVFKLLEILDLDSNNKVDIELNTGNLQITTSEISGIPFVWSTEVQIRTWT